MDLAADFPRLGSAALAAWLSGSRALELSDSRTHGHSDQALAEGWTGEGKSKSKWSRQERTVGVSLSPFSTDLHSVMMNQDRITLNFFSTRRLLPGVVRSQSRCSVKNRGLHYDPTGPAMGSALTVRTAVHAGVW